MHFLFLPPLRENKLPTCGSSWPLHLTKSRPHRGTSQTVETGINSRIIRNSTGFVQFAVPSPKSVAPYLEHKTEHPPRKIDSIRSQCIAMSTVGVRGGGGIGEVEGVKTRRRWQQQHTERKRTCGSGEENGPGSPDDRNPPPRFYRFDSGRGVDEWMSVGFVSSTSRSSVSCTGPSRRFVASDVGYAAALPDCLSRFR